MQAILHHLAPQKRLKGGVSADCPDLLQESMAVLAGRGIASKKY